MGVRGTCKEGQGPELAFYMSRISAEGPWALGRRHPLLNPGHASPSFLHMQFCDEAGSEGCAGMQHLCRQAGLCALALLQHGLVQTRV